jgi:hypothetical protein
MTTEPTAPTTNRIEAILRELREELRRSAAEAPLPPPFGPPPPAPTEQPAVDRLLAHVKELQAHWRVELAATPMQLPVVGGLYNRLMGRVHIRLLRWLMGGVVQQQVDFNAEVVRLSQHTYQMLRVLQDEARYLREETSEYDHHAVSATRRLAQLETAVRLLAEEVADLKAAASPKPPA